MRHRLFRLLALALLPWLFACAAENASSTVVAAHQKAAAAERTATADTLRAVDADDAAHARLIGYDLEAGEIPPWTLPCCAAAREDHTRTKHFVSLASAVAAVVVVFFAAALVAFDPARLFRSFPAAAQMQKVQKMDATALVRSGTWSPPSRGIAENNHGVTLNIKRPPAAAAAAW